MNSWTDYFWRITDTGVRFYGVDLHLQVGWLGLVLGLGVFALLLNRAFPNLKRLPHFASRFFSRRDMEVVPKSN